MLLAHQVSEDNINISSCPSLPNSISWLPILLQHDATWVATDCCICYQQLPCDEADLDMPKSVQQLPRACLCMPLHSTMRGHRLLTAKQSASAHAKRTVQSVGPHSSHVKREVGAGSQEGLRALGNWSFVASSQANAAAAGALKHGRRSCRPVFQRAAIPPDSSSARSSSPSWSWSRYSKICLKRLDFSLAMRFCMTASHAFDIAVVVRKARITGSASEVQFGSSLHGGHSKHCCPCHSGTLT